MSTYELGYQDGTEYATLRAFGAAYPSGFFGTSEQESEYWNGVEDGIADIESIDASL